MLKVKVERGCQLYFVDTKHDTGFRMSFQRTLRIPDDGKDYPLPPGLGTFPVKRVLDYADHVPERWRKTSGVFIPMFQREAMWISFFGRSWRPNALKIAAGKINAVSGEPWHQELREPAKPSAFKRVLGADEIQDYLTCPPQPWLDGFNTGEGTIRQFVAMPLGMGYTVEGQVTGKEEHGGVQVIVYEPRAGRFPDAPPPPPPPPRMAQGGPPNQTLSGVEGGAMPPPAAMPCSAPPPCAPPPSAGAEMGLGGGGTMKQKIYPDPHGVDTWDPDNYGRVFVHIVNSAMYREITGEAPPPSPVTARSYTTAGYPWFKIYDEEQGDVTASPVLDKVKSIKQMDDQHGFVGVEDNAPVEVKPEQIKGAGKIPRDEVPDGEW